MSRILRTLIQVIFGMPILLWAVIQKLLPPVGIMTWTWPYIELILSEVWNKGNEKGMGRLFDLFTQVYDAASVEAKLESIKLRAMRIKAMLNDAEQRRCIVREDVLNRLAELRAVAFDFDDVVEEFETKEEEEEEGARHWIMWRWYCLQVSEEIDDIEKRCNGIIGDRVNLDLPENEAPMRSPNPRILPPPQIGWLQGAIKVHGRDAEISEVVECLLKPFPGAKVVPVISIEGAGGIGKTTIAQHIFEDTRIRSKFQKRIWVDLSPEFDATKIIKGMITKLNNGENCPSFSLDMLLHRLKSLLENSTFLLVLDNVWNEDAHLWDVLHAPLVSGRSEPSDSKILMTTRSSRASDNMHALHKIPLNKLDCDSMWSVLCDHALAYRDHEQIMSFMSIGRNIAGKCDGSPLAAKLLGVILSGSNTEEDWESVLNEMPDPRKVVDQILPALKLSYDQLPLHLKRCFAYCSIFPKGYEFDKDELVKFWMAEGLIDHDRPRPNLQIEDTGLRHFDDLLRRSFFHPSNSNENYKQTYQMPSQIHDLAQSVSSFECLRANDLGVQHGRGTTSARYALLSYPTKQLKNLKLICKNKRLRTLILHNECTLSAGEHAQEVTKVPSDLLELKRLRVLDMSYSQIEMLPASVGDLVHLRYLGLRGTWLRTLPQTVKGLYKLETLELGECYKLKALPKEICSLTTLRHLGLHLDWENWDRDNDNLTSMPPSIGELTNLQTLSRFIVASDENCRIDQLGNLNRLRGELCISKLENVADGEEASRANLSDKGKIDFLMLCWSLKKKIESACDVISGLKPHTRLKSLYIENYAGIEFPVWMEDGTLANLETLKLYNSESCKSLSCLAKLPRLKNLYIKGFHEVRSIPTLDNSDIAFAFLEVLHLSDMNNLEALFVTQDNNPRLPRSLRKLEIRSCPKLILNPFTRAPSLRDLVVSRVNWAIIEWFPRLVNLHSLTILEIHELRHILRRCFKGFNNLQTLKIKSCIELESLAFGEDMLTLSSLRHMEIYLCPKLNYCSIPGVPTSHRTNIVIYQCPLLEQFFRLNGVSYTRMEEAYRY